MQDDINFLWYKIKLDIDTSSLSYGQCWKDSFLCSVLPYRLDHVTNQMRYLYTRSVSVEEFKRDMRESYH